MAGTIRFGASAKKIRGVTPQLDFSLSVVPTPSGTSTGSSQGSDRDVVTTISNYSVQDSNFKVQVSGGLPGRTPTFTSLTPAICSVDAQGNVTRISDGVGTIEVYHPGIGKRTVSGLLTRTTSSTATSFSNFQPGSLSRNVRDNMLALIAGKSPGATSQNLYTQNNYFTNNTIPDVNGLGQGQANNAIRNPSSIAASLDTTGIAVGTWYGGIFPCHLIGPRHVIMADHVSSQARVAFKGNDGNFYYANIVRKTMVPKSGSNVDVCIGYLDTAIPAAVTPFKVLPPTYKNYLPSGGTWKNLPILSKGWTAGDKWRIHEGGITNVATGVNQNGNTWTSYYVTDFVNVPGATQAGSPFADWYGPIINGDSSGCFFMVVTQSGAPTPILLGCYANTGGGILHSALTTEIEAAMNALKDGGDATTYSLQKADLSAFNTY